MRVAANPFVPAAGLAEALAFVKNIAAAGPVSAAPPGHAMGTARLAGPGSERMAGLSTRAQKPNSAGSPLPRRTSSTPSVRSITVVGSVPHQPPSITRST